MSVGSGKDILECTGMHTKFPISVEPRAKMKVMSRQAPFESSLTVDPTLEPSCLGSTVGRAAAEPARRAMAAVNFMFAVVSI